MDKSTPPTYVLTALREWEQRLAEWLEQPVITADDTLDYHHLAAISYAQLMIARLESDSKR